MAFSTPPYFHDFTFVFPTYVCDCWHLHRFFFLSISTAFHAYASQREYHTCSVPRIMLADKVQVKKSREDGITLLGILRHLPNELNILFSSPILCQESLRPQYRTNGALGIIVTSHRPSMQFNCILEAIFGFISPSRLSAISEHIICVCIFPFVKTTSNRSFCSVAHHQHLQQSSFEALNLDCVGKTVWRFILIVKPQLSVASRILSD